MNTEQREPREAICVRCGADASWQFVDLEKQVVEVICLDCGRFEVPKAEFEQAGFETVPADERRE